MSFTHKGSVRADLFGGTLDIDPIGLILSKAVTLNLALSLQAKVVISKLQEDKIQLISLDYNSELEVPLAELKTVNDFSTYGPLGFLISLIADFGPQNGLKIEVSSDAPAGSGLGGSSSLGVVFYQGLSNFFKREISRIEILTRVKNTEAITLSSGPTGYQDYYPALFGGILALKSSSQGVQLRQLYSTELKQFLEEQLMLVYSGETRFSGMNNWEVYKGFFDKDKTIVEGFKELANISSLAEKAIENKEYQKLLFLLESEGEIRKNLFPAIVTEAMNKLMSDPAVKGKASLKICGAGGGGCMLLIIKNKADRKAIRDTLSKHKMRELDFKIMAPIDAK